MKKLCKLLACLGAALFFYPLNVISQLAAGDMVVLGINAISDKITFATLVDIPAGTTIKITDNGWNGSTNAFTTFTNGDGVVTWTTPSVVTAGSIFTVTLGGTVTANNNLTNVTTGQNITSQASFTGYASASNTILLNGEQVFIYQGADNNPFFIFGLNASRNVNLNSDFWQTQIDAVGPDSMLPDGSGSQNALVNGVNAVGILTNPTNTTNTGTQQFDNVYYNGPVEPANKAVWLARIVNRNYWTGDDAGTGITSVGTTLGTSAIALPVTFGTVSASVSAGVCIVSWQTLSETNNDHFEVQVSEDGKIFTTVYTLASKARNGNSDSLLNYSVSFELGTSVALSGLGLLSLLALAVPGKRRKWISLAVSLAIGIAVWSSCTKADIAIGDGVERIYVRIAQADKDGTKSYSKAVVVNNR
ncbi:MAG: hypothetical protein QM594_00485 [Niabella sp.]